MKINFHGELKRLFGPSFEMKAETVGDALEGFSRQVNWPKDLVVEVVGFDDPDQFWALTDVKEIDVMPALFGGGGKFGQIIIGVILIAAAFLPFIPANLKAYMIISGATMILSGVIGLFMKAPTISKSNDPQASKYLGVNKNTVASGTPITLAWGRVKLAGHWLSVQANSNQMVQGVFPAVPT